MPDFRHSYHNLAVCSGDKLRYLLQSVEATLYASLMAINNAGSGAGRLQGALFTTLFGVTATQFAGMPWLVLTCSVLRLAPLAFLWLLPRHSSAGPLEGQRPSVGQV